MANTSFVPPEAALVLVECIPPDFMLDQKFVPPESALVVVECPFPRFAFDQAFAPGAAAHVAISCVAPSFSMDMAFTPDDVANVLVECFAPSFNQPGAFNIPEAAEVVVEALTPLFRMGQYAMQYTPNAAAGVDAICEPPAFAFGVPPGTRFDVPSPAQVLVECVSPLFSGLVSLRALPAPFPFQPNQSTPIRHAIGTLTDVQRMIDGAEQRRALRQTKTGSVSFAIGPMEKREAQAAASFIAASQGITIGVPLWGRLSRLDQNAYAGTSSLYLGTDYLGFVDSGFLMLWIDSFVNVMARIAFVGSGSISLLDALEDNWPMIRTVVVPVVPGRLRQEQPITWESLTAGSAEVAFDLEYDWQ